MIFLKIDKKIPLYNWIVTITLKKNLEKRDRRPKSLFFFSVHFLFFDPKNRVFIRVYGYKYFWFFCPFFALFWSRFKLDFPWNRWNSGLVSKDPPLWKKSKNGHFEHFWKLSRQIRKKKKFSFSKKSKKKSKNRKKNKIF